MARKQQLPTWGPPGDRTFRGAIGLAFIRYEDEGREQRRREEYARATLREDGEHYLPTGKISLEEGERWEERSLDGDIPGLHRGGFREALKLVWASVWHMGMYAEDPYLARIATVHTVQEQVGVQRQTHAQERAVDAATEEQRMRQMARIMAEEMLAAAERSRSTQ